MSTFWHLGHRHGEYGGTVPVQLSLQDRRQHVAIFGRTGVGKSNLLAQLFRAEAMSGRGAMVIDPHGDLAVTCLAHVPTRRANKVLYINPADLSHPVGFNILEDVAEDMRGVRADEVVGAFKSIYEDFFGPRMERIFRHAVLALLEVRGATLVSLPRFLTDDSYRERLLRQVSYSGSQQFWGVEFVRYEQKFGTIATDPVINKVDAFLSSPSVRNILGQRKSTFSPRFLMDNNYLVVVNISKGLMGEHQARLFGALLVSAFGSAALSRADTPEQNRKDFALIVDEYQNILSTTLPVLLSEARKYRLSLVLATQHTGVLSRELRDSVFGNVGSLVAFRAAAHDTDVLSRELSPLREDALTDLPSYQAWVRTLDKGQPTHRVLMRTEALPEPAGGVDTVVRQSRRHFAKPREKVERWIGHDA